MKKVITAVLLCFCICNTFSQNEESRLPFNFGFEQSSKAGKLPEGWFRWGTDDYNLKIDSSVTHSGKASVLIESTKNSIKGSFGCIAYAIPADYLGKEIEVRAYLRVQDITDSEASLLLRIDDKNKNVLEVENGYQKNIQGSGYWNYYSVSLPFPAKAKTIYIGAMLSGTGKVWVDDFQVLIDGKDISRAKRKAKIELKADRDREFDSGSRIKSIVLTEQNTQTLLVLGKVWGFLKYYHPAIAKGNYNWDYELFRILPPLLECKSKSQRNALLLTWTEMLGETISNKGQVDSSMVKLYPDIGWINDTSELGEALSLRLKRVKDAKRPETSYYLDISKGTGVPDFTNEDQHDSLQYPDVGFQLLSLYRYWNIIQYYYPYRGMLNQSWDNVLMEYLPRFVNASAELEYKLAVLSVIGRIQDGNANIMAPNPVVTYFKGINKVPVDIGFVENKAIVTDVFENALVPKSELRRGDVILKVNDRPTEDIIMERKEYTPASNKIQQLRNIGIDLLRTNDTLLNITFQRGDSIKYLAARCYSRDRLFRLKNLQKKDTCFKMVAESIVYINTSSLKNNYLERTMPSVFKTKGMIIDLRGHPLESSIYSLGKYLIPVLTPFAQYTSSSISTPGLFTFSEKKMIGGDGGRHYKGKVVVLVNEQTQGSAEYHAMAFKVAPKAILMGSSTAGTSGSLSDIYLPGGIRTLMSGVGVYFPNGGETHGDGIRPLVFVSPTIKGVSEGRDELVEKAIELINKY